MGISQRISQGRKRGKLISQRENQGASEVLEVYNRRYSHRPNHGRPNRAWRLRISVLAHHVRAVGIGRRGSGDTVLSVLM